MPDGEGYMFAGELPVGAYTAAEMGLGEVLRPLAGFGRGLDDPYDEDLSGERVASGAVTGGFLSVRYVSPDQLETWAAVRGWQTS